MMNYNAEDNLFLIMQLQREYSYNYPPSDLLLW